MLDHDPAEIVERYGKIGMIRAKHLFVRREVLAIERLRAPQVAALVRDRSQRIAVTGDVGAEGSFDPEPGGERFGDQPLRSLDVAEKEHVDPERFQVARDIAPRLPAARAIDPERIE